MWLRMRLCFVLLASLVLVINGRCGSRYFYLSEYNTQPDARLRCRQLGYTDLATVDSLEKANLIEGIIEAETGGSNQVWFGLEYNMGLSAFYWPDGSILDWSKWNTNMEPNDMNLGDVCVRMQPYAQYKWGTYDCTYLMHAMCENTAYRESSGSFVHDSSDVGTTETSMATPLKFQTLDECSVYCLDNCSVCSYFVYLNDTCTLFPRQPSLSVPQPGAKGFRRLN